jgi:hypothetical protein
MPSLLDKQRGYAAMAVRRALGKDDRSRIKKLERDFAELERVLDHDLRQYTGMTINDFSTVVDLDHKRRHHWECDDGTITFERIIGRTYGVNACVDIEVIKTMLLADPDFINAICAECPGVDPG